MKQSGQHDRRRPRRKNGFASGRASEIYIEKWNSGKPCRRISPFRSWMTNGVIGMDVVLKLALTANCASNGAFPALLTAALLLGAAHAASFSARAIAAASFCASRITFLLSAPSFAALHTAPAHAYPRAFSRALFPASHCLCVTGAWRFCTSRFSSALCGTRLRYTHALISATSPRLHRDGMVQDGMGCLTVCRASSSERTCFSSFICLFIT